jgi:hypothetical protein
MAANKFVLKGSGVEVDYTIGATPSLPALVYKAGAFHKSFKPAEILSEDTGLGRMVSVSLIRSIRAESALASFCRSLTWIAVRRRTSTRSAFMKRLADRIPFRIGLRYGVASK